VRRRPASIAAAVAVATVLATAAAGCGVGAGEAQEGTATLTVTRDFGAEPILEAIASDPPASETITRFLDREAEVETSYGGNFIDSIEGLANQVRGGRSIDWFFYVNGYWSPVGAGEARLRAGDRVWWDYHDWTDAYRVPAVVGSFPEPLRSGGPDGAPVEIVCFDVEPACDEVAERLAGAGAEAERVEPADAGPPERTLRVLVGSWERVSADPVARLLERGPGQSGVYAAPRRCAGELVLDVLDDRSTSRARLREAGFIAATARDEGEEPTWVISATGPGEVDAAAALLEEETLADHYAIATAGGEAVRLPASADVEADRAEGECR
jgi:hypothetical protein